MDPEYTFTVRSYVYNVILIPYVDIPGQLYTRHAVDADSDTEPLGVDPLSARIMQPVIDDHPAWIPTPVIPPALPHVVALAEPAPGAPVDQRGGYGDAGAGHADAGEGWSAGQLGAYGDYPVGTPTQQAHANVATRFQVERINRRTDPRNDRAYTFEEIREYYQYTIGWGEPDVVLFWAQLRAAPDLYLV